MSYTRKSFGSFICFLFCLFTYTPLKSELVDIAGNATLTNNAISFINSVFGYFWALMAIMFLALSAYWIMKS